LLPGQALDFACTASLAAIAKRVLGLLVVGVIGGVVLFKLGLSAFQ
jgi:hypothetical protein